MTAGRLSKLLGEAEVDSGFATEHVVEASDASFGANRIVDHELNESDNFRGSPAIAVLLIEA